MKNKRHAYIDAPAILFNFNELIYDAKKHAVWQTYAANIYPHADELMMTTL